ncbi:alanine racemase, partial [candidate division KSB1 bacterium]|nr:alanine racemase [candidate division KSB1 bacterium]
MNNLASERPAWVEIDLDQLRTNFDIIRRDMPAGLGFVSVVKDEAYGHGMVQVARTALQFGATAIALATVDEALQLRQNQVYAPILVFGERTEEELEICVTQNFTCIINDRRKAEKLSRLAKSAGKRMPIHVEVDTGLSRYGVKWSEAPAVIVSIAGKKHLHIEGVMSHFAMSDELDKTFALQQLERFRQVMAGFDFNRALIGMQCVGTAQASVDETWTYVVERKAFGSPLVKFEGVSFPLAEQETLLEAARLLCLKTLWLKDAGQRHTAEAAMCKWWAPKVSFDAITECLLLHGHAGYSDDYPHQQRMRDVLGLQIGDGTAQIMKLIIAR